IIRIARSRNFGSRYFSQRSGGSITCESQSMTIESWAVTIEFWAGIAMNLTRARPRTKQNPSAAQRVHDFGAGRRIEIGSRRLGDPRHRHVESDRENQLDDFAGRQKFHQLSDRRLVGLDPIDDFFAEAQRRALDVAEVL